jgi:hypothetical protein
VRGSSQRHNAHAEELASAGFRGTGQFGPAGFEIRFENDWTVSVRWGPSTATANANALLRDNRLRKGDKPSWSSPVAEVSAWDARGNWHLFEGGSSVRGFLTPAEVVAFLARARDGLL